MELSANVRRAPLRLTTGAFVLNSGVTTFNADEQTSKRLQQTAAQWLPQVNRMDSRTFAKTVAAGEVALGTALMLPVVPAAIAGLGLTAFAASLLAARGSAAGRDAQAAALPTDSATPQPAVPKATEAWMLGSGVSLLLDALTAPAHDKSVEVSAKLHEKAAAKKRHLRRSRRRAAALSAVSSAQLGEKAHEATERMGERLHDASERIVELRDEYQPVAAKKLKRTRKQARKKAKRFAEAARASAETAGARLQDAVPA